MSDARLLIAILAVEEIPRARAFYRAAFGWPLGVDVPVYCEFRPPGGSRVAIYQREHFGRNTGISPAPVPAGALSPAELYLHVDDLDPAIARLEAAGARLLSPRAPRLWGDEAAYFADPDGHVLAVARPLTG